MPTTKSTITITNLQDAAGNLLANAWVTVRLNAGVNGGVVDGAVIATPAKVQTDASGDASIQLYPNSAITPADSYYTIAVDETSPLIYRTITVPSGGVTKDWSDATIQTEPVDPNGSLPAASAGTSGQYLRTDGSTAAWDTIGIGDVDTLTASLTTLAGAAGDAQSAADAAQSDADAAQGTASGAATAAAAAQVDADAAQAAADLLYMVTDAGKPTDRFLRIGAISGHDAGAFTTPNLGDEFTSGFFALAVVRPIAPSSNDQANYIELLTQTHDGSGTWDNFEWALEIANGRAFPYFEWTEEGGSSEALGPTGVPGFKGLPGDWTVPFGQWSCIAVDLAFNVSGQWRGRHLRQVFTGENVTIKGLKWEIVRETTGNTGPTEIDTGVTYDWGVGFGTGNAHVAYMAAYNGSSGALVFELDPQDATVSTELDDSVGNTWTAGAQAFVAQDVMPFDQTGGSVSDGSITTAKLADSAVTSAKIANGTIAAADLASDLAALIPTRIAPSENKSVSSANSSTTLVDVPGLSFAVTAGRTYDFDGIVFCSGDSAGDGKIGVTFPTGTMRCGIGGLLTSTSSLPGSGGTGEVIDASGESVRVGLVTGSTTPSIIGGTYVCTSSGTVQFQWAQNASNATASVLEATGSRISYTSRTT